MAVNLLLLMCTTILNSEPMPETKLNSRVDNCVELGQAAETYGHDPLMVIAIAHTESRFDKHAVSRAGAVGILQILPKYFCPSVGPCNHLQAGLFAWRQWKKVYRSKKDALCGYNSGKRCKNNHAATGYANLVLRKYSRLKRHIR